MRILVTGSTGLIGSALIPFLRAGGHEVVRLVRAQTRPQSAEIQWDPAAGKLDASALEGFDGVVHLSGENIGEGRWTAARKQRIYDSRIKSTQLLSESLAQLRQPPKVLVCASAIGYYGDRGDELLREDSAPGSGFLADLCRNWEAACEPAARKGIRVVNLRNGVVLSGRGGALPRMVLPFRMFVGGKVGSGKQFLSWIALDDTVAVILHALSTDALQGPVTAVALNPVTNLEFTKILGRVLRRPTVFPVPAFIIRLAFGQMGEELLLASQRVEPTRLMTKGFAFRYPQLEGALRHALGK
ncbi:MAG TPA: TIGR01777 family oxidoreductase [Terriglobia bacterium]|nr:TIGR01777 family oxidoreductase [Terriglobia bacterium]